MPAAQTQPYPRGLDFEQVWAALMENREQFKETDRKIQEVAERQKENARQLKETERIMKEKAEQLDKRLDKQLGKLGNRFGELVEHLVAPNLSEKFNELGFCFTKTAMDVEIKDPQNPKNNAEVDVLLENGDIVIAVEVKSKPNDKDVDDHVRRMGILRRHADEKGDRRKYQGAIAAAVMGEAVRRYVQKKGFYVIEQTGDTVRIHIPKSFKARNW
jgi:hypothetical protein